MQEKLQKLNLLFQEIKCKLTKIQNITTDLKHFNTKMNALLQALDAYSSEDKQAEILLPENLDVSVERLELSTSNIDFTSLNNNISFSECLYDSKKEKSTIKQQITKKSTLEEIWTEIILFLPDNKLYRTNAYKIVKCLYENRNGLTVEIIIKNTGVAKYRCIDTLNHLIKNDPPFVKKVFEKAFIYMLNL
ncbi:hypothetical protein CWI38_0746p0040 [Hamiltosporidium tvaerminnensis]|uniref:Uncharacterized protein n=1 Tax=Hamiltosporidium tvaerminnensis TaxID=1176355 RepID=A0A4V2JXJ6_9MICR|nr:hypothetical protein LUQ84_000472 [Hamiltosporidium tvaerminnensis]TBU05454.1 hypothetical protein CWI37_0011p0060 [Hamiltosporidium tvaerminnensis]TBU11972.1 hypothetical protein CWI38_0957p0020 [Hamiltosporidium tvaerminnensis]TBU12465.1 hypothetical protein CWI38_0746p0040 [Hamiltosporidium tvaerminnensis]